MNNIMEFMLKHPFRTAIAISVISAAVGGVIDRWITRKSDIIILTSSKKEDDSKVVGETKESE